MKNTPYQTKARLRRQFIAARSAISDSARARLDARICDCLVENIAPTPPQKIAAYIAIRGEVNLMRGLESLAEQGHRLYLPVLVDEQMRFRSWQPEEVLKPNRFGIPEPVDGQSCRPEQLETVLMPLVAHDSDGARLGMGGGYYDRSFAFRQAEKRSRLPQLIGIAYGVQMLQSSNERSILPTEAWDVRLDGVISEHGWQSFNSS